MIKAAPKNKSRLAQLDPKTRFSCAKKKMKNKLRRLKKKSWRRSLAALDYFPVLALRQTAWRGSARPAQLVNFTGSQRGLK